MITWESDAAGIVTLTFDDPERSANTVNDAYRTAMRVTLARCQAEKDAIKGIIVASAKSTFFAGADLNEVVSWRPEQARECSDFVTEVKGQLRTLETLGIPVVAAITGSALGGGLELALACRHRVVLDRQDVKLGLPEVGLGLLPGGGGVVRTVRLLGLLKALDEVLLPGRVFGPEEAVAVGLADELAATPAEVLTKAREWLMGDPESVQPWDAPGYRIPGGTPSDAAVMARLPLLPARLRQKKNGSPMPAARNILSAAVESTQVDFETASRIETCYFVQLATGQIAKNIVQGTFFDLRTIKSGASRPTGQPEFRATTIAVLGAGMMGGGIAYTAASVGITVLLKDIDLKAAQRGKQYSEKVVARAVKRGRLTPESADALLERIIPVSDAAELGGADVVIEAVFENPELKKKVYAEVEPHVAPDALLASNTSTLPITDLADGVTRPADFVGLHFFSPVEQMGLVEVIAGRETGDQTLARAIDLVRQLRKVPIVVNDARGFFTSRVILQRLLEAASMVAQGVAPATIEQASKQAGYPMGTLALLDEVSLSLPRTIRAQFREAARVNGIELDDHPGEPVLAAMLDEHDRPGRAAGAGFYDYSENSRTGLWPGLTTRFPVADATLEFDDLKDRLLFAEALESARCLGEGVLRSTADANVGSLMGIGYPTWTGGVLQFIAGYPGGVAAFVARAIELADRYGPRFAPPQFLVDGTSPIEVLLNTPTSSRELVGS